MADAPGTYNNDIQAKRHADVMDALHTIGRNIAQQDVSRREIRWAIEHIGNVLTMASILAFVAVMIWVLR